MVAGGVGPQVNSLDAVDATGAFNVAHAGIADQREIKTQAARAAHANGVYASTAINFGQLGCVATRAKIILQGGDHAGIDGEDVFAHAAQQNICTIGNEGVVASPRRKTAACQSLTARRSECVVTACARIVNSTAGCKGA